MGDAADQDKVLLGLVWPATGSAEAPGTVRRLADAMYDVQAMSDHQTRQNVLRMVKTHNRDFDPEHNPRDNTEIMNFIAACGKDDTSFDLLLNAIRQYAGEDDPGFLRLKKLVNELPLRRAALTKDELRELLALEPDSFADSDVLPAGIRRGGPEPIGREGRDIRPRNVREAALFLLDVPSPEEGLCRLFRFVDWLAKMAMLTSDPPNPVMAGRLHDWIDRVSSAHGLTAAAWRAPVGGSQGGEPSLLIELEPTIGDRFVVYLWLWVPGSGARTLDWDQDSCRLDELRVRLDELIELASRGLVQTEGRLRVEFLLDLEILNQDVDWWPFGADLGWVRPLGAEHEVVVRRHRTKAQEQRNWQTRWQALKQVQAAKPVSELIVWVRDAASLSLPDLWTQLDDDPTKVLVAPLGSCGKLDGGMKKLLLLALTQGMPVALCVRRAPADAGPHLESLKAALANAHLAELPALVRGWRKQALSADGNHFGHDLVLLWDDFDRQLPDARSKLALPAVKGAGR